MILAGVSLILMGLGSFLFRIAGNGLSPALHALFPILGAVLACLGAVLLAAGARRCRSTKVFDTELDKMTDAEVLQTVKEIEAIKEGNQDTFVGMLDEAPLAETKAELDELVDRYSERLAVSRQTVMTVLKHSRKVRKLKE